MCEIRKKIKLYKNSFPLDINARSEVYELMAEVARTSCVLKHDESDLVYYKSKYDTRKEYLSVITAIQNRCCSKILYEKIIDHVEIEINNLTSLLNRTKYAIEESSKNYKESLMKLKNYYINFGVDFKPLEIKKEDVYNVF